MWKKLTWVIGAGMSEPHTCEKVSLWSMYVCMYVCIVFLSVNNCSRVLIHWTASILQCVIQFPKCHQVQMYFNFACAMTTTTWLNSTCKPSCLSLYTRLHEYCKSPSSLCYLCRSWIIHCVGLRQTNASIANVQSTCKLMAGPVHCLLLNSTARLLASVCTLMSTRLQLITHHQSLICGTCSRLKANTNALIRPTRLAKVHFTMSCICLVW